MTAAPGPYDTLEVGAGTGFHSYVVDANGRKIGVAWGPHDEKVWTAALFAASYDLLAVAVKISAELEVGESSATILARHTIELNAAIRKAAGNAPGDPDGAAAPHAGSDATMARR